MIDLVKLADDVVQPDAELQVLAMQTLLRMEGDLAGAGADVLARLRTELGRLATGATGDSQFFARQCLAHLDRVAFAPVTAAGPAGAAAPPARTTVKLSVPPELIDPAVLQRAAAAQRPDARPAALSALGANVPVDVLATALTALTKIGQPGDLAAVTPFLKHRDPRVRANAVEAVEVLAPIDQRVFLLLPLIGDGVDRVRANAIKALGACGEDRVYAALEGMLASASAGTRASAVWVLRAVRGDRAVELLWKASRDPLEAIRLRVVEACKVHRHPQAREILRRLSNDIDISIAEAAYSALAEALLPQPVESGVRSPESGGEQPSSGLRTPDSGLGPVESLASADPEIQVRSLKEIEVRDLKEAREAVIALVHATKDEVVLGRALMTIGAIGGEADAALAQGYLSHPNDRVRANAVEAVTILAPGEVVLRALTPLVEDRDNRVRGNVVKALAQLGVSGMDDKVDEMLVHGDVLMRLSGAWAASFLPPAQAFPLLARAARDSDADVRRMVVESLGRLPATREIGALVRELGSDGSPPVSAAARALMEKLGPDAAPAPSARDTLKVRVPLEGILDAQAPAPAAKKPASQTQPIDMAELKASLAHAAPAGPTSPPTRGRPANTLRTPVAKPEEALAVAHELDELYGRLDAELEEMGREIFRLQDQRVVSDPVFSKVTYQIKRYADLLAKREAAGARGFLSRLPFFKAAKDPAKEQLEQLLREEHRKLGETAIELYHMVERSFPPLAPFYERVGALLRQVKDLRDRNGD